VQKWALLMLWLVVEFELLVECQSKVKSNTEDEKKNKG
jgi:hypothetical protein